MYETLEKALLSLNIGALVTRDCDARVSGIEDGRKTDLDDESTDEARYAQDARLRRFGTTVGAVKGIVGAFRPDAAPLGGEQRQDETQSCGPITSRVGDTVR